MKKFVLLTILVCSAISVVLAEDQGFVFLKDVNRDGRIIQGSPAGQNQFPFQTLLYMKSPSNEWVMCGGALISTRWVLTAAHCLVGRVSVIVRLGSVDSSKPQIEIPDLKHFIIHENYDPAKSINDVGIVDLGRNVAITASVRPIRLPRRSQATESFAEKVSTLIGWGYTHNAGPIPGILNYVQLKVITNKLCIEMFGYRAIAASNLCAVGIKNPAQGACSGDSGSPLFLREADGIDTHIAITSFVTGAGCEAPLPTGFARTSTYIDWIAQKTGIAVRP